MKLLKLFVFSAIASTSVTTWAYSPLPLVSPNWYSAKYNGYKLIDAPLTPVRVLEVLNGDTVKVQSLDTGKIYEVTLYYVYYNGNQKEDGAQFAFLQSMVNHKFLLRSHLEGDKNYGIFHLKNGDNVNLTAILNGIYELNDATASTIFDERGFLTLYKYTQQNKVGLWRYR